MTRQYRVFSCDSSPVPKTVMLDGEETTVTAEADVVQLVPVGGGGPTLHFSFTAKSDRDEAKTLYVVGGIVDVTVTLSA